MRKQVVRQIKLGRRVDEYQASLAKWTRIYAIASIATLFATVVLLFINGFWIKTAREQLAASVDPTVELNAGKDTLWVKNTGIANLLAIRIEMALYYFDSTSAPRLRSIFNHPIFERGCLSRGDSAFFLPGKWRDTSIFRMKPEWATVYVALVLHFRREVDNRSYLVVRSFLEGGETGWLPLFHVPGYGTSLPIPEVLRVTESIRETELKLYRAEQPEAEDLRQ